MDIATYLQKNGISQEKFAKSVKRTQSLVSQWVRGVVRVSHKDALLIERRTMGQVSRADLFPELFKDRKAA